MNIIGDMSAYSRLVKKISDVRGEPIYSSSVMSTVESMLKEVPIIPKKVLTWHNKKYFLLGIDEDGKKYYLEDGKFECGWYWGFGYVETFTNNRCPEKSADISSHSHFDSMFCNNGEFVEGFKAFFIKGVTLTDKEIWKLLEFMGSFYTIRKFADLCHIGGSNVTSVAEERDMINSEIEESGNHCNKVVIPNIIKMVQNLLSE